MSPTARPSPSAASARTTWAQAAEALALRVTRRDRQGVVLSLVGRALLFACVPALAWRAFGPAVLWGSLSNSAVVATLLGLGALVGIARAWRAAAHQKPSTPAYAAWALDRLARGQGRGIAAACALGPAASEAAFGGTPLLPPPAPRLLPPRGLVPLVGGLLLGVLGLLAPAGAAAEPAPEDALGGLGAASTGAPGAADAAANEAERRARALDAEAREVRAVRKALNLPPAGPLDPAEIKRRLADGSARRAAAKAAGSGSALAEALKGAEATSERLAGLLDPGEDNRARAQARRREATAARAGSSGPHIPADRRNVVSSYFQRID